jgi:hypothetical protein
MNISQWFGNKDEIRNLSNKDEIRNLSNNSVKSNKFFTNLMCDYHISYEDAQVFFVYAGGNLSTRSINQSSHYNYHRMAFKNAPLLADVSNCVCEHPIKNNCFIFDTRKKQSDKSAYINVGNCCIKRFMKNSGRTCGVCKKGHKNRKDNICNLCRDYGYKTCYECQEVEICDGLCVGCLKQKCKGCKSMPKVVGHYCESCNILHCPSCDKKYKLDEREHWRKECKRCWWKKKNCRLTT